MKCREMRPENDRFAVAAAWRERPDIATAMRVVAAYEAWLGEHVMPAVRVFIARSFAVEPLVPLLRAAAFVNGIHLTVRVGDFNAYAAELLDDHSELYRFHPDIAILAVNTLTVAPALLEPVAAHSERTQYEADVAAQHLTSLIQAFRRISEAHLIVHSLEQPDTTPLGTLDYRVSGGQRAAIAGVNERLNVLARETPGVHILDYDALVARHGRRRWVDAPKWERYRIPVSPANMKYLVDEWLRFIHPIAGVVAKVAAVDLDNTLWGGIVGEEGLAGISLDPHTGGAPYRSLQRALLALRERGVVLAVCSKNNEQDALEVFERHAEMLLRPDHFAALFINWRSKAENLRSLALQLNVGLDAIAFIDDSAAEREEVRATIPSVHIIDLPSDPERFAEAVLDSPLFERIEHSIEDAARPQYYREQQLRAEQLSSAASKEDFLFSLQQHVEISGVTAVTLARAAQLSQRTNQFNLTTRRYTEQQLSGLLAHPGYVLRTIRVTDRFGDSGIVGLAITRDEGECCSIESFLLSCRVIGRGIETALLARVADEARCRGRTRLVGAFIPTAKNNPAAAFFLDHGFRRIGESEGGSIWEISLADAQVRTPAYVSEVRGGEMTA